MTSVPNPQFKEGYQKKLWVDDQDAVKLLKEVLIELKRIRIHLEVITDENITEGDIE